MERSKRSRYIRDELSRGLDLDLLYSYYRMLI